VGYEINPWIILPFGLLLAAIALGPIFLPNWWPRHYSKVAYSLGAITALYYALVLHAWPRLLHVGHEYASFIILIGALFVVSGGIHINVKGEASPHVNTAYLFIGALLANLLGTTGASMLLIRPWIRMNKYRVTAHHIVFFMFIVSNVGGCLTPVGDPPLFLGYLKGIPFWWVAQHCWPMWAVGVGYLLALFYVIDSINYRRAPKTIRAELAEHGDQWCFEGLRNLIFLLIILGAVFINHPAMLREALMLAAAAGSWFTTPKHVHTANHFNFHPIQEVAILFVGIFATMMPAQDWLQTHADKLANPSPALFYWGSGLLSSVLDNAPTYSSFLSATLGLFHGQTVAGAQTGSEGTAVALLLADSKFNLYILAISIGAVFFGANTYIGNGPNFMVKAIAEHQKVGTPGFLRLVIAYTLPCMLPMLVLIWLLFFRN
jgi:Na+/H+ antiporter NhaD/arsenite permease-like protein